jgi:tetratricopeptide (TPR) repeat protein
MTPSTSRSLAVMDLVQLHRAGSAWTDRGTQRLVSGGSGAWAFAVRCHRRAIELLSQLPLDENSEYLADLGTAWLNLGCALLSGCGRDCTEGALSVFERAVGLMERLPLDGHPRFRHNLAAGWLNRAEALVMLGEPEHLDAALTAYARAIELSRTLPLGEKSSFRVLLASCWINLGNLQQRLAQYEAAVASYEGALVALDPLVLSGHRLACHHGATAGVNRAEALLCLPNGSSSAAAAANTALALIEGRSLDGAAATKLTLRALRAVARALECELRGGAIEDRKDRITFLTDVAERGLALALTQSAGAPDVFEPFACWFFSFGSRIYGRFQPQFLAEYLQEGLALCATPSLAGQMKLIARQAAQGTLEVISRNRIFVGGSRQTEVVLDAVRDLRAAAAHF